MDQHRKIPSLSIYWGDTKILLSYKERKDLENNCDLVTITPEEVLLEDRATRRKVVVRGVTDAFAPVPVGEPR